MTFWFFVPGTLQVLDIYSVRHEFQSIIWIESCQCNSFVLEFVLLSFTWLDFNLTVMHIRHNSIIHSFSYLVFFFLHNEENSMYGGYLPVVMNYLINMAIHLEIGVHYLSIYLELYCL